jgi:hypothetical protein
MHDPLRDRLPEVLDPEPAVNDAPTSFSSLKEQILDKAKRENSKPDFIFVPHLPYLLPSHCHHPTSRMSLVLLHFHTVDTNRFLQLQPF